MIPVIISHVFQWHLGFFKTEYLPTSRGFDSHLGYWTGKEDYFDHMDFDVSKECFTREYYDDCITALYKNRNNENVETIVLF